jgi:hypothetical protein
MKRNPLRLTASFLLGFLAGLSFLSGVLPFLVGTALGIPSIGILMEVDKFTRPVAVVWGVCGAGLPWTGRPRTGALLFGACGLLSGLFLGVFPLGGEPAIVGVSALAGLAYGGSGGLLLGNIFAKRTDPGGE